MVACLLSRLRCNREIKETLTPGAGAYSCPILHEETLFSPLEDQEGKKKKHFALSRLVIIRHIIQVSDDIGYSGKYIISHSFPRRWLAWISGTVVSQNVEKTNNGEPKARRSGERGGRNDRLSANATPHGEFTNYKTPQGQAEKVGPGTGCAPTTC